MMESLREWLTSIVAVTMLLGVVQQLTGEGTVRKIASFTGGLVLLAAVLRPLPGLDIEALIPDMERYSKMIETEMDALEEENRGELAGLIESRTSAYISEQAERMGYRVHAHVQTAPGPEDVPIPWSAELTGESSPALAAWIQTELGIPEERQVWNHEN